MKTFGIWQTPQNAILRYRRVPLGATLNATAVAVIGLLATPAITRAADAPQPISVAVLNVAGPRRTLAENIESLITVNLSSDPRFTLVDRAELDKILGEQALGQSGNITPESAAKIGKLTGAKILITGREFSPADAHDIFVVIANVIGTETGRVFSRMDQGKVLDQVTVVSNLTQKIEQLISTESSRLLAQTATPADASLEEEIARLRGKTLPPVQIAIAEKLNGQGAKSSIAETELGRIFHKAGFSLVDAKSKTHPGIVITGDAITGAASRKVNLFSCPATVEIKVVERASGDILALDLQRSTGSDISAPSASAKALERAADELAVRVLPVFEK